jgi:acetyl esterase/lipase
MNPARIAVALSLCLSVSGFARAQAIGEKVAAQAEIGAGVTPVGQDSFANTTVAFPGGVVAMPDVTYSSLNGYRPLKLDLFLPPAQFKARGPRPLLIYIHGGGFMTGGPRRSGAFLDWPNVLAAIAEQGYVVAAVSYRFSSEAPFPAQIQDVKSAIRWLRVNAAKYNIDPQRAMTWGQSAGGHLAAMAAVSCHVPGMEPAPRVVAPGHPAAEVQDSAPAGFDEASDCVQGAVVWYGIFDFATQPQMASRPNPLLGCGGSAPCSKETLAAASPVTYVTEQTPPFLILHGTEDKVAPIAQSEELYDLLRSKGVKTEFIKVPGVGHSLLGKTAEETSSASKMALERSLDFIDATIGDKAGR